MRTKPNYSIPIAVLVGLLAGAGAAAQDSPARVEGEVVRVMQQTRAGEPANLDAVMVRTRNGERMRLLLGQAGDCPGCVQVGDQVRARLMKGGSSADGHQVRTMKVQRTGERTRFRNASGELLRTRSRNGTGDGSGTNDRARSRDNRHRYMRARRRPRGRSDRGR